MKKRKLIVFITLLFIVLSFNNKNYNALGETIHVLDEGSVSPLRNRHRETYTYSSSMETIKYSVYLRWEFKTKKPSGDHRSNPSFKIFIIKKDGSVSNYSLVNDTGSFSGLLLIPPESIIKVQVYSGERRSWHTDHYRYYGYGFSYKLTYGLDEQAPNIPNTPQISSLDLGVIKGDTFYTNSPLTIIWKIVDDNPSYFYGKTIISGMKDYIIDCNEKSNASDINELAIESGVSKSFLLPYQGLHYVRLRARDFADNISSPSPEIKVVYDNSPPAMPGQPGIEGGIAASEEITWKWTSSWDEFSDIKGYEVYIATLDGSKKIANWEFTPTNSFKHTVEDGKTYICKVIAIDNALNKNDKASAPTGTVIVDNSAPIVKLNEISYPFRQNGNKVTILWPEVTGDYSGIKKYQVALTTSEKKPDNDTEIYEVSNSEFQKELTLPASGGVYYAWVRAVDNLDNEGDWVSTGPFPEFDLIGPADNTNTNQLSPKFGIGKRSWASEKDLRYKVYYQKTGGTFEEYSGSFSGEGSYKWYIEVYEYLNGIKQEDSKQTSKEYTLHIDKTAPIGSFGVSSVDGSKDYTQVPTNKIEMKLTGIKDSLSDELGMINSGIKGIYLWDKKIQTSDEPLEQTLPTNARYFEFDKIPANGNIEWQFIDENGNDYHDGIYRIHMIVEDGVGNYSKPICKDIILDTEAPGAPADFSHSHRVVNNTQYLKFAWQADVTENDIFRVSYILPDNTEKTVVDPILPFKVDDVYTGEWELNVTQTGVGPNQQIKLKVIGVDPAGNEVEAVCENVYTLALPGDLINFTEDYYFKEGQYKTRFSYELSGGVASNQYLEISRNQDFTADDANKIQTILPINNKFTVDNLDGHGTYWYRLVATNNSNPQHLTDRSIVNFEPYQVPNYAPIFPDNGEYIPVNHGYATLDVKFSYPKVNDPNNDAIKSYKVKYALEETYQEALWDEEKGYYYLKMDQSAHGKTYSWYVEAEDQLGAISRSETFQFTVDANAPTITSDSLVRPYSNQRQLQIIVTDELSGISKVQYTKIDATTNLLIGEPATVVLSNGCGVIPLTEGYYHLNVIATDQAGNETPLAINNVRVDHTLPVLSNVAISLDRTNGTYCSSGTIPVMWNATDAGSGIKGMRYWITDQLGEPIDDGQYIALSHGLTDYAYTFEIPNSKETGERYYLAMTVYDRANNQSEVYKLNQPILLDTTPPRITFSVTGFHNSGSGYYLDDLARLNVSLEAVDEESGHRDELAIVNVDGTPVTTGGDWDTIKSATLISGNKYRISARSVNGVGLETEAQSPWFVFDNTVPAATVTHKPQFELATGETASYIVNAVEDESAITAYRLAIGNSEKETALTSLLPENKNGWYEVKTNSKQANFRIEIPDIDDGNYNAIIEIINAVGLKTRVDAGTIVINNSRERVSVSDQGPYTLFTDRLTGWWKYNGSQKVTSYYFRVLDQDNQVVSDWQSVTETMFTVTQLQLENGKTYRFEVKGIFEGNLESVSGFSPGVTVDATKPEISKFNTPLYATPWNIGFTWEGKDDESGIKQIFVALGTDYQKTDITKGWVEVAGNEAQLACDVNGEELVFDLQKNNRYYLTLRVINGAGLVTEMIAPAMIIDTTAPPVPVVTDQGAYINTSEKQPLEANWFWSVSDPDSETNYQWTILKYGEKVTSETVWHEDNTAKKISLNMDPMEISGEANYYPRFENGKWYFRRLHGDTYYFAVKAINGAGLTSIGYSNGIMVDETAPIIPKVVLVEAANFGDVDAAEVNYITSSEGLGLWIDSLDPDNTPLDSYLYAWNVPEKVAETGRLASESDQITLTSEILSQNPTLIEGQVNIFAGECSNEAILTSATGYSMGVMLDTGAPKITNVRGCVSGDRILFDWDIDAESTISPLVKYEYILVKDTEKGSVPDENRWQVALTSSGSPDLSRRLVIDGKDIADGNYCLLIKGLNAAGTYSRRGEGIDEWGVSPVIVIDRTPPMLFENDFKYPVYADQSITVKLVAEDKKPDNDESGSGIQSYQYALGTRSNPFQFSDGWTDAFNPNGEIELKIATDKVPHNTGIYLMVRVKDNAGLWSKILTSRQILVDHTAPSKPVVSCVQYTNSINEIKGIEYNSVDLESNLISYRLGVVTDIGKEWLFNVLENIDQFDGNFLDLYLTEAGVYYLAMQTQNGAGIWSEISYSDPIKVDTVKPVIGFTRFDEQIVINEPPLNLEYTLSENAQVRVVITGNDGVIYEDKVVDCIVGINQYSFTHEIPQEYLVSIIPTDLAGNIGLETEQTRQRIRVNAPPVVSLPDQILTTPGKPLKLTATVKDPDGVEGDTLTYEWLPGDGGVSLSGAVLEYRYTVLGEYMLTLIVTDKDGGKTTVTTTVKVGNTTSGYLYMDEVWSGIHRIYADVIVPEGINLTIKPDTQVIIDGAPGEVGYFHGLIIKGNLVIEGSGVTFNSIQNEPGAWKGIRVEGRANIDGVDIQKAVRGLTVVNNATVTVANSNFHDNQIGIHIYQANPIIQSTVFRDNYWYGIKEDGECQPVVTNCTFTENEVDYYHDQLTVVTIDELNDLGQNDGNRK